MVEFNANLEADVFIKNSSGKRRTRTSRTAANPLRRCWRASGEAVRRVAAKAGRVAAKPGRVAAKAGRVVAKAGRVVAKAGRVAAKAGRVAVNPRGKARAVEKNLRRVAAKER